MEQVSYYTSAGAFSVVIICWFAFLLTFLLRKKPEKAKDAVKLPKSWLGIALQGAAYAPVWITHRTSAFSPFVPSYSINIALQIAAAALAIGAVFLTRSAIDELGKQWSLQARLVEDHQLVKTGSYNFVRHPIYSAMLADLIATGIVISHWAVLVPSIALFLIGTFIRIEFEERLLKDAFGEEFREWRSRVPALVPFLRF